MITFWDALLPHILSFNTNMQLVHMQENRFNMPSKHSNALQTSQTCSFAILCPVPHTKVAFVAPCSCVANTRPRLPTSRICPRINLKCCTDRSGAVLHEYEVRYQFYTVVFMLQAFKVCPRAIAFDSGPKPP